MTDTNVAESPHIIGPMTQPQESKSNTGRKTLYDPSICEHVTELCRLGAKDTEIAENLGIHPATLYDWKNKHPEFSEAIKKGKTPTDAFVASQLYRRATGYEWTETQPVKLKSVEYRDGERHEEERVEVVEVQKSAPPDTTAAIFWLKNRRSEDWKDKREVSVDHIHKLSDEQLDARIASLQRQMTIDSTCEEAEIVPQITDANGDSE